MSFAGDALTTAIFTRLTTYTELTALLNGGANGVYDYVTPDAGFPYVVIGDDYASEDGDKTQTGQEFLITIHVFDSSKTGRKGRQKTRQIMSQVINALDRQETSITPTGFSLIMCMFESSEIFIDDEDKTNFYPHGVLRFRVLIRELDAA